MRHAYNLAIFEWELIDERPFARVKITSDNVKRVKYLFPDEEERLMNALPQWLKPIVTIARESGLRLSNIIIGGILIITVASKKDNSINTLFVCENI